MDSMIESSTAQAPSQLFEAVELKDQQLVLEKCPVCGSKNFAAKYKFQFMTISRCRDCEMLFASRREYQKHYHVDDWETDAENIELYYDRQFDRKNPVYLEKMANHGLKGGDLLEIGAAYGAFLHAATQKGWRTTGIELSKTASLIAKKKFGLSLINEYYVSDQFGPGRFDVVAMFDVIEHIDSPLKMMGGIKFNLRKPGHLVFTVPNNRSLTNLFCFWSYFLTFGKLKMPAQMMTQVFYHSHHVLYFDKKNIRQFLKLANLEVVEVSTLTTLYADEFFGRKDFAQIPLPFRWVAQKSLELVQWIEGLFGNRDTLFVIAAWRD